MKTSSFEDLNVWKSAHQFVLEVYRNTEHFPKSELFGITSQFRRSSVSIPANIAEGYRKRGKADKLRFFNIAQGSLEETKYYLILSHDLGYLNNSESEKLFTNLEEVSKLLNSYFRAIYADLHK
jgi:four helix bundle protein